MKLWKNPELEPLTNLLNVQQNVLEKHFLTAHGFASEIASDFVDIAPWKPLHKASLPQGQPSLQTSKLLAVSI